MEREILFRGLRVDSKGWAKGLLFDYNKIVVVKDKGIRKFDYVEVYPESVGQFTGLTDKNGNKIFEGDYDEQDDVVLWCDRKGGWSLNSFDFYNKERIFCRCYECEDHFELKDVHDEIEIIGNIHEK